MSAGDKKELACCNVQDLASLEYDTSSSDEECKPEVRAPSEATHGKQADTTYSLNNLSAFVYDSSSDDENVEPEGRTQIGSQCDCEDPGSDNTEKPPVELINESRCNCEDSDCDSDCAVLDSDSNSHYLDPDSDSDSDLGPPLELTYASAQSQELRSSACHPPRSYATSSTAVGLEPNSNRSTSDGLSRSVASSSDPPQGAAPGCAGVFVQGPGSFWLSQQLLRTKVAPAATNHFGPSRAVIRGTEPPFFIPSATHAGVTAALHVQRPMRLGGEERLSSLFFSAGRECSSPHRRAYCRCAKGLDLHARPGTSPLSAMDEAAILNLSPLRKHNSSHDDRPVGMAIVRNRQREQHIADLEALSARLAENMRSLSTLCVRLTDTIKATENAIRGSTAFLKKSFEEDPPA